MTRNTFDLAGKVAVVTGATGLLGREHCDALAGAGATVVAVDVDREVCTALSEELVLRHGGTGLGMAADITRVDDLQQLKIAALERFEKIDVLVNNAAVDDKVLGEPGELERSRFENYPLDSWRCSLEVNVTGTFLCCQILGAVMAERQTGSIINVASTYGIVAPDQRLYRNPQGEQTFFKSAVYPTSKGAVLAFTRFLAAYWGRSGVRVNALSPGGVRSQQPRHFLEAYGERTPLGRMAEPGDYRGAVVFLASDTSSYMTGANLVVDGGWTIW